MRCRQCGELTPNKAYCTNVCQQRHRQAEKVAHWLATGEGRPHERKDHWMRLYLLEQQGQCCALCRGPQTWNGVALVFILDHVNGDATNHRRENLRMVCPNCNSQLPTHCGGNRGNGKRPRRYAVVDTSPTVTTV